MVAESNVRPEAVFRTLQTTRGMAVLLLGALSAAALRAGTADPTEFTVPQSGAASMRVDARAVIEPVNRRVLGVCAIYPPFDSAFTALWKGCFDGSSIRIWANTRFFDGGKKDLEVCENAWETASAFARVMGFVERIAFCPFTRIGRKAHYTSEAKNNLDPRHRPSALAAYIRWLNETPHPGAPEGFGVTGWEVWNEPQFPASGAWDADDYARYVLDCAAAVRRVAPSVEIGASLHEADRNWNRRMLGAVAARAPNAISFVVSHPYDFSWIQARRRMGDYYARVSGAEVLRLERIRPKVEDVFALGHGRWRLVCSEWNTHPPGYTKPYNVSTDIATAVHIAAMFGVFWDEHVDSAQFFQLYGRGAEGHFSLVRRTSKGPVLNPTGAVFRLYTRLFRGDRLAAEVTCPSWPYPGRENVRVPMLFGQAARDGDKERLVLMIGNRHRDRAAAVSVTVTHFAPRVRYAQLRCVTADAPNSDKPRLIERRVLLPPGPDPSFRLEVPAHSVSALTLGGIVPPTEDELFSQRLCFIQEWRVSRVLDPGDAPDHGLGMPLPKTAEQPVQTLTADSTGFVNLGSLLAASGRAAALREGFQARALTWIFSPVARTVGVSLGLDYWGTVRVNGELVLDVREAKGPPRADQYRGKARLNAGWTQLAVRVASGSKGFGFWPAVEQTGDLRFQAADSAPPWPRAWWICADRGADVNSWKGQRDRANPDRPVLQVSPKRPNLRRAYVRWPRIALPPGANSADIQARIILTSAYRRGKGRVWLRPVRAKWDPRTLTFSTQPKLGPPLPRRVDAADRTWVFQGPEIDALVRNWIAHGEANFGIAVESDIEFYAAFASDDDPLRAPRLELRLPEE
ncbi:MAG: DNRLRE domain-containing protein [Kiritimatiellaeota bacterium]|nr:DNRLRE domain-containing protein [Kiritimatiellota bacterium]